MNANLVVTLVIVTLGLCNVLAINEPAMGFPSFNGVGHNPTFPNRGRTGRVLVNLGDEPFFGNGYDSPRYSVTSPPSGSPIPLPNEREISNLLHGQFGAETFPFGATKELDPTKSLLLVFWGQFLDHDLSLTTEEGEEGIIEVEEEDLWMFEPLEVEGSTTVDGTGVPGTPAEFPNELTAWIDAGMVYGSDLATANSLRATGGFLLTNKDKVDGDGGSLLPLNTLGVTIGNDRLLFEDDELFAAGDRRVNENVVLTAFHTLFVREHNRKVYELMDEGITDPDELYNKARLWVIAVIQSISAYSFLPEITGEEDPLGPYLGFNDQVFPDITAAFSTAAFRFGHSMLSGFIPLLEDGETKIALLRELFSLPGLIKEEGISSLLNGCAHAHSEKFDALIVDDVRNHLFALGSGAIGGDLMARNLFRGRNHGLAPYNKARENFGLEPKTSFQDITGSDLVIADILEELYDDLEDVDLWAGGTSEPRNKPDGVLGETFSAIIVEQFKNIRNGDYFWFENPNGAFTPDQVAEIKAINLGDIIRWNTNVGEDFPSNVFRVVGLDMMM